MIQLYKVGDIVRYNDSITGLMKITRVAGHLLVSDPFYYGEQYFGEQVGSYQSELLLPSEKDLKLWKRRKKK